MFTMAPSTISFFVHANIMHTIMFADCIGSKKNKLNDQCNYFATNQPRTFKINTVQLGAMDI